VHCYESPVVVIAVIIVVIISACLVPCLLQMLLIMDVHSFLSFILLITSDADHDFHFPILDTYVSCCLPLTLFLLFSGNKQLFYFFFSHNMTKEL